MKENLVNILLSNVDRKEAHAKIQSCFQSLSREQWDFDPICTATKKLTAEFFRDSPFGQSLFQSKSIKEPESPRSRIRWDRMRQWGFPRGIWELLKYGVPLLIEKLPKQCEVANYSSVMENLDIVSKQLDKKEQMGVFKFVDFRPHTVSPLGLVEQDGTFRVFLDTSASGLNKCITTPKFKFPRHVEAIINLQEGDFRMKADLEAGFHQLPVREDEETFLGFFHRIKQVYCVFTKYPFGVSSAPFLFCTLIEVIRYVLKQFLGIDTTAYVDDWLFNDQSEDMLKLTYEIFLSVCDFFGIGVNLTKTVGPTVAIEFLGLRIDTVNKTLSLPETKREAYYKSIKALINNPEATMGELASVAGKLVHVAEVQPEGFNAPSLCGKPYTKSKNTGHTQC